MWWRLIILLGLLALLVNISDGLGRRRNGSRQSGPSEVVFQAPSGNAYQFVSAPGKDWLMAYNAAASMTYNGRQGHLATITSTDEAAFIWSHFANHRDIWIGASDSEQEGVWQWVAGPETGTTFFIANEAPAIDGYSNWSADEPNDRNRNDGPYLSEDYAIWNWSKTGGVGEWNDISGRHGGIKASGFLVEFPPPHRSNVYSTAQHLPRNIISFDANWRFHDQNSDLKSAWREPDYDDSAWSVGRAPLGYEAKEATTVATERPTHSKPLTVYFRHTFEVQDPSVHNRLLLGLMRDDGAAVYLNGKQVLRDNLAENANFHASALRRITDSEEELPVLTTIPRSLLRPGKNVIAVEVHQHVANSSDLLFSLTLGSGGANILSHMLSAQDSRTRYAAANIIGDVGEHTANTIDKIIVALKHGDSELKAKSARALAKIGPKAQSADGRLRMAIRVRGRRNDVQHWAAIALAQIDPVENEIEELSKQTLSHIQVKHRQSLAHAFNAESWLIVRDTNRTDAEYQYALTVARASCLYEGKSKHRGLYLNTLGVAQYRVGLFGEAQKSLGESHKMNSGVPADLAFLAMTCYRLGERERASQYLESLKILMLTDKWSANSEAVGFLREAEAIVVPDERAKDAEAVVVESVAATEPVEPDAEVAPDAEAVKEPQAEADPEPEPTEADDAEPAAEDSPKDTVDVDATDGDATDGDATERPEPVTEAEAVEESDSAPERDNESVSEAESAPGDDQ